MELIEGHEKMSGLIFGGVNTRGIDEAGFLPNSHWKI